MIVKEKNSFNNSYIALGSFDGLHMGHLSLINKAIALAKQNKGESILYNFKNHPKTLINKNFSPKLLLDNENKEKILYKMGIDYVYFEEFNEAFMKKSPEDFIKYICDKFKVKGIIVGFNYKFGYKNLGDVNLLRELQDKYGYKLYVMEACTYLNDVVSSTRIRNEFINGNIEIGNKMLTREYFLEGEVIHGKMLGRQIGFPTANIDYSKDSLLPKEGVYYTNVLWNNKLYKGITSIGNTPTVKIENITVETFILDFNEDIYGDKIKVYFLKYIRGNVKFNSLDELIAQLNKDRIFAEKENLMESMKNDLQL